MAVQLIITALSVWMIAAVVGPAVDWALHTARWSAVLDNLRLFVIGTYPSGPVGGLALTALLTLGGGAIAFPLGILLALGRRSRLPLVKSLCVGFIETVRGVPLVTVLYMVALLVPLILPDGMRPSYLLRAIAGLAAFTAAYVAEDVRGGLSAVDHGQGEAAQALGLSSFQTLRHVILPQALRLAMPALVGQLISLFKNTVLVIILGDLRELVGVARTVANQPAYLGTYRETYAFIAVIFFAISYAASRASRRLETRTVPAR